MLGFAIPPEFPLADLSGQEVTQVCIGLSQVQIQFYRQRQSDTPARWEAGARIDVEAAFTLHMGGSHSIRVEPIEFKLSAGMLAGLLGEAIVQVTRLSGNEIQIQFSNSHSLQLHTDPQGFESFHLHVGGESITVSGARSAA